MINTDQKHIKNVSNISEDGTLIYSKKAEIPQSEKRVVLQHEKAREHKFQSFLNEMSLCNINVDMYKEKNLISYHDNDGYHNALTRAFCE